MALRSLKLAVILLLFTSTALVIPAFADDAESQLQTAKKLLDQAATILEAQLQKPGFDPSTITVQIQNTAQSYQIIDQPKQSLDWWQKLIKVEPDNWRAWAKVVQCAQALNDLKERDMARDKVLDLNKLGKVDQKMFCREQFSSGDKKIMAFEFFKPDTEFGIEFALHVSTKNTLDSQLRRYTLGESTTDTQVARELKEIGPNDHMYSVDGFDKRGQWLLTMTTKKPTYEELRAMVITDLDKQRPDSQPENHTK